MTSIINKSITTYDLKMLAAYLMVMDHLGIVFGWFSFRLVGRFALPMFGYLFVNGIRHTSSHQKYYFRLLIFALISQIPYALFLVLNGFSVNLNILFLFVCAYPLIYYYEHNRILGIYIFSVPAIVLSRFCDAGLYGLMLLLVIYFTIKDFKESIYTIIFFWFAITIQAWHVFGLKQVIAPLVLLIPSLSKVTLGNKARWFYWFYPVHLVVLDVLSLMVIKQ